jgi:hypothetical protein
MVYGFGLSVAALLFGLIGLHDRILVAGMLGTGVLGYLIFNNTMDLVQGLGPVYWVSRRNGRRTRWLARVEMRETDPPYRQGSGIQIKISPAWTFHIGFCRRMPYEDPVEVVGRWMDEVEPEEIKTWVDEEA